ncbi:UNVERIFIED_CONTAM: hypothetical protein GTU68_059051 [Idotea baltica]|nr:hypothetical protein [Idotea baltica]
MRSVAIKKLLVANRGEIAIRIFRACTELGIRTVAVYSYEDRFSLHRFKADEAYQLGEEGNPVGVYLDIQEVVSLAKSVDADAVHPGYGFLSERSDFANALEAAGITFVGPSTETLNIAGDKTKTIAFAKAQKVPTVPGSDVISGAEQAKVEAKRIGYPVMLKASFGGGGRGIRRVNAENELDAQYQAAVAEAGAAFGRTEVFVEKFVQEPKHIEVQLFGDGVSEPVHLFERDCSIQRRNQKVCEIAPAIGVDGKSLEKLYEYGLRLARGLKLRAAATAEFLVSFDEQDNVEDIYFIEINPRIQVEHTVTEEYTGIDVVQSQIRVCSGESLSDLGLSQDTISGQGVAIQCRITTEDPLDSFSPNYGRLIAYRSASGFGIRLDAGSAFTGSEILPFYDSMLVKITARGNDIVQTKRRMLRALSEFRIRGVQTNIAFLENLLTNPSFSKGNAKTNFLETHPEIFEFKPRRNRANKLLTYLSERSLEAKEIPESSKDSAARQKRILALANSIHKIPKSETSLPSWKELFDVSDRSVFLQALRDEKRLLICDTTLRDAHQSLLATRMRTADMLPIAPAISEHLGGLFSLEMWGGATFDVMLRFLQEDPWERVRALRRQVPNVLFQMLLRGANGVGYKSYPKSLIREFIFESKNSGIDVFRVFDSLNNPDRVKDAMRAVRDAGDVLIEEQSKSLGKTSKFDLEYYLSLAKTLVDQGADILAIKDMAGLLRPHSAERLVSELRNTVDIPIHFHTHDTAGGQTASYLKASEAGVDIVDCAFSSLAGMTSQPPLEVLASALEGSERDTGFELGKLTQFSRYWDEVRPTYSSFESDLKTPTSEVYLNEIPGGQYSNLRPQAASVGLGDRFSELKEMYAAVNKLFGSIVKVTPSSKVVGDLSIFLLLNNLSIEEFEEKAERLDIPQSVVAFFEGDIGVPHGGFPEPLRTNLVGTLPPCSSAFDDDSEVDFAAASAQATALLGAEASHSDTLSYLLYPKVFEEYAAAKQSYGELSQLPTYAFFRGLDEGEEVVVDLERGKRLFIKLIAISDENEEGFRTFFYELNGQPRQIVSKDKSSTKDIGVVSKADPDDPLQAGAPLAGALVELSVAAGDHVEANQALFTIEAMKMQTIVRARVAAKVSEVCVAKGRTVSTNDLVLKMVEA